jgi:hypothetical protein
MDEELEQKFRQEEERRDRLLRQAVNEFTERMGEVPPPWAEFPDTHPFDICWRMGGGEWHVMVWGHWWHARRLTHERACRLLSENGSRHCAG